MAKTVAMVFLAVSPAPEMAMPPTPRAKKEDEKGEHQSDGQGELGAVFCREITGVGGEIKRERQEEARH